MGLVDVGGAVSGRERRSIHVWSIYTDGPFVSWSTDDQIDLDGWSLAGVHAEQKDRPAARQRTHEGVGIWFGRRLGKWRALARSETQPRTQIITHVPQAFGEKWGSQLKSTCLHARINLLSCHWLPFAFAAARCRANRWRAHFRCSCGSRVGGMSFFACGSSDFCAHNLCGRRMYCRIYIYIYEYIYLHLPQAGPQHPLAIHFIAFAMHRFLLIKDQLELKCGFISNQWLAGTVTCLGWSCTKQHQPNTVV